MRLHTYVIAVDAGSAPNYDAPHTTLAVCKPRIRQKAEVGDVVLAFTGRTVSREPHAVCWAGLVREKLTFAEYWKDPRFKGKKPDRSETPDNFYRPVADGTYLQVENPVHGPDSVARDLGGYYILVCEPAWRFGASGPVLPSEFGYRISPSARRGERVHGLSASGWHELRAWLDGEPQLV
jgi:hypothetical protein